MKFAKWYPKINGIYMVTDTNGKELKVKVVSAGSWGHRAALEARKKSVWTCEIVRDEPPSVPPVTSNSNAPILTYRMANVAYFYTHQFHESAKENPVYEI